MGGRSRDIYGALIEIREEVRDMWYMGGRSRDIYGARGVGQNPQ